jgi:hypothetical protein
MSIFTTNTPNVDARQSNIKLKQKEAKPPRLQVANTVNHAYDSTNELATNSSKFSLNTVDKLLESEVQRNKAETWNKLDNTMKLQLLHQFADKYTSEQSLNPSMTVALKQFFANCLEKNKLQKSKDVVYNKTTQTITSVPALYLNTTNQNFTLRIMDAKRVSTLKSLTPLRTTPKQIPEK